MSKTEPLNEDFSAELRDWGAPVEMCAFEAVMHLKQSAARQLRSPVQM